MQARSLCRVNTLIAKIFSPTEDDRDERVCDFLDRDDVVIVLLGNLRIFNNYCLVLSRRGTGEVLRSSLGEIK